MARRKGFKSQPEKTENVEQTIEKPSPKLRRWAPVICLTAATLIFLAIYILRLDHVVGMMVDDAWYVLLAKALATGQGYRIINAPGAQIMPLYPPGFPLLLSFVFRIAPQFPENYWLLKAVSIAAMMGTGVLTYIYCKRYREMPDYLSFLIAFTVAIAPPLAYFATSTVMSECVFALTQLGTIIAAERCVRARQTRWPWREALLCSFLASYTFLVRSVGVGLLLAVLVYLLKERLFRHAILVAAGLALFLGPWMVYSRINTPTEEQRREQNGHIVEPYTEQFWQKTPGARFSGRDQAGDLPARVWKNVSELVGDSTGELLATPFHYALKGSGENMPVWLSLPISLILLLGYVVSVRKGLTMAEIAVPLSLGVLLVWPWPPARLVLPMLPFLIIYFITGMRAVFRLQDKYLLAGSVPNPWKPTAFVAGCLLAINLYGNVDYIAHKYSKDRQDWIINFEEHKAMLDWMRDHISKENAVATNNAPLVFLYAGLKSVTIDSPEENWERWKRLGIRYLARSPLKGTPLPPPDFNEGRFNIVYRSTGKLKLRVSDFGPAPTRIPWNSSIPVNQRKIETFN